MTKCVICEHHPAEADSGYCHNCGDKIASERKRVGVTKPVKYLHYRGTVVALIPNGNGTLRSELSGRSLEGIPACRVIDLDHYVDGFDREMIKRFKRCCIRKSALGTLKN